jgi:hypothetical protein
VITQDRITKFSSSSSAVASGAASVLSAAGMKSQNGKAPDPRFLDAANYASKFQSQMASIEKASRKIAKRLTGTYLYPLIRLPV